MAQNSPELSFDEKKNQFNCIGSWSVMDVGTLFAQFTEKSLPKAQKIRVSGKEISHLDSAGALTLIKCIDALKQQENQVELTDFSERQRQLLDLIYEKQPSLTYQIPVPPKKKFLLYFRQRIRKKISSG